MAGCPQKALNEFWATDVESRPGLIDSSHAHAVHKDDGRLGCRNRLHLDGRPDYREKHNPLILRAANLGVDFRQCETVAFDPVWTRYQRSDEFPTGCRGLRRVFIVLAYLSAPTIVGRRFLLRNGIFVLHKEALGITKKTNANASSSHRRSAAKPAKARVGHLRCPPPPPPAHVRRGRACFYFTINPPTRGSWRHECRHWDLRRGSASAGLAGGLGTSC